MARKANGFTIIELMIATVVFSMVIILITVGVLSFTRSYYKGVNQSNTQNTARQIIEEIAQSIQFSGGTIQPTLTNAADSRAFCINNQRYSYVLGKQLSDDLPLEANQTSHAFVVDKGPSCAGAAAQNVQGASVVGTELLGPRMRLSKMSIQQQGSTDLYRITVRIVYGDDDLLTDPTGADAQCNTGIKGTQYCAQSELTTVVQKRIAQ